MNRREFFKCIAGVGAAIGLGVIGKEEDGWGTIVDSGVADEMPSVLRFPYPDEPPKDIGYWEELILDSNSGWQLPKHPEATIATKEVHTYTYPDGTTRGIEVYPDGWTFTWWCSA